MIRKLKKFLLIVVRPSWARALLYGVAAAVEHSQLPIDPSCRTVIDAGANRGQFALFALHRCPAARVHCLEPLARPRARLAHLFRRHPRIEVHAAAAGARAGHVIMHVAAKDDSSSILPIATLQTQCFPGTHERSREEVDVVRLDELLSPRALEKPVLLKIDVQGSELDVLHGAAGLISEVDQVLVECSFVPFYVGQPLFPEVHRWLDQHGFELLAASCSVRDNSGAWLQADLLYRRQPVPRPTGERGDSA